MYTYNPKEKKIIIDIIDLAFGSASLRLEDETIYYVLYIFKRNLM